ncbi:MAG: hypothetical protein ABI863_09440 [Ginsengibacter sp.]
MRVINNEDIYRKDKPQTTSKKQFYKYRFYNLLFNGKISMKEYLNVLHYMESGNKQAE